MVHAKIAKIFAKNAKKMIMNENEISYQIIGLALALHKNLGPGLLESVYENALMNDLIEVGFKVRQQVPMPFVYKNIRLDVGYRIDLLVEEKVIIEVKSIENLSTLCMKLTVSKICIILLPEFVIAVSPEYI